jgi:low affinity Fe/Cu permease
MPQLQKKLALARKTFTFILILLALGVPLATIALVSGPAAPLWMDVAVLVIFTALAVLLLIHSSLLRNIDVGDKSEGS